MFDEFRAPAAPNPGMREFAIVATRARAIRRRRHAWTALGAVAVIALMAVTALVIDRPDDVTVSTDDVPTTQLQRTDNVYSLDELAAIDQLPALATGGRTLPFVVDDQRGEVFAQPDGSVCVRNVDDADSASCAAAGAGFHVALWNDAAATADRPLAIFLIASDVSVAIKALDNECRMVLPGEPIDVWACLQLDPLTTSVRVIDPSHVLINTVA